MVESGKQAVREYEDVCIFDIRNCIGECRLFTNSIQKPRNFDCSQYVCEIVDYVDSSFFVAILRDLNANSQLLFPLFLQTRRSKMF